MGARRVQPRLYAYWTNASCGLSAIAEFLDKAFHHAQKTKRSLRYSWIVNYVQWLHREGKGREGKGKEGRGGEERGGEGIGLSF